MNADWHTHLCDELQRVLAPRADHAVDAAAVQEAAVKLQDTDAAIVCRLMRRPLRHRARVALDAPAAQGAVGTGGVHVTLAGSNGQDVA